MAESRKVEVDIIKLPKRLLITYQRSTYEHAKKFIDGSSVDWWIYGESQPFCIGRLNNAEIGLGLFCTGASAAVMMLEEVIACGARTIFEVGLSGGLQTFLQPSKIVVVTEAIRDEGTSHHYLPPDVKAESSSRLRNNLIKDLNERKIKHHVGSIWTTDGLYRETRSKFRKFKNAGVLGVNMETSAIFAVAKYRNVDAASAQVISDILTETGWAQAWEHQSVLRSTEVLLTSVLGVLSRS